MRIEEIKSFNGRVGWVTDVNYDPDQVGRALFTAAIKGLSIPELDVIMTCDPKKVGAGMEKAEGDSAYILYNLGSRPDYGYAEITNPQDFKLSVSWESGKISETRVTNPRLSCIQALKREDVCKMRIRIDGTYYKGHKNISELLDSIFPVR